MLTHSVQLCPGTHLDILKLQPEKGKYDFLEDPFLIVAVAVETFTGKMRSNLSILISNNSVVKRTFKGSH